MAPGNTPKPSLNASEAQLKDIVQNLYNLIVQCADHQGLQTQTAMKREIQSLIQNLMKLHKTAEHVDIKFPDDVIYYVEGSRNPDIFTREFVELVQRMNQHLKGRTEAYLLLRDSLAKDIISAIPELREDVREAVESTGGTIAD